MFRHPESNPHFLPRQSNNDPVIEFPPTPGSRRPPPPSHHPHVAKPTQHTKASPPHHQNETPPQTRTHFAPEADPGAVQHGHNHQHHHPRRRQPYFHGPSSQPTRPFAWLVAAFCVLFWILIIVGGLIILIVYLVFRPRSPRFDISTATMNAAYLDMGYLLNADVTVLANFSNLNTKVNVDFSYVVLDLYYDKQVIATRYIEPFSVGKSESRFENVHMMTSQVRLSMGQSVDLQKQIGEGRVNFEIRGLFRTKSKLGGIFHYSYWLYAHCNVVLAVPPTGVLIAKHKYES